jgi:hypothetical protein
MDRAIVCSPDRSTMRRREEITMTNAIRITVAVVLALGFAAAYAQGALAAAKSKHHTAKPKVEYMRSAAPADTKQK